MTDIKLRNVKLDDANEAIGIIKIFLREYPDRMGFQKGVVYSSPKRAPSFYVYKTSKTIICVGYYADDQNIIVDFKRGAEA